MLAFEVLMITGLHELIEVAIHVLHTDVEFAGKRVEEDVEGGDEVRVNGECAKEDHFTKF